MKIRTILPLALVATLFTGCASDDADIGGGRQAGGAGEPVALSIAPESVTRTVTFEGDAWEGGEEVAVSIGGTVKKYVVGADKTTLSPATDVTPFIWTSKTETKTVEAWYPYADTKPAVTVPADQSTEDKFRAAIMLEATVADAPFGPVALTFTHRTVKVIVRAIDGSTYDGDLVLLTNLSGVSSGTTVKTYKRNRVWSIYEFYALVAPQTVAAGTSLVTICKGGDVWTYKHSAAVNLQAGGMEAINVDYNSSTRPTLNGHKYVEMGDGLKWATCNVGAQNPMDYGDYFQWGATVPYYQAGYSQENPCTHWISGKTGYDWESYPFMEDVEDDDLWKHITKYTVADGQTECIWYDGGGNFIGDGKTSFADYGYADDAARANWGGTWRTPTDAEWTWLRTHCTWTWTNDYLGTGVKGRIVTSNVTGYTGNSIFLPATGDRIGAYLEDTIGFYWSSSLYESDSNFAWGMRSTSNGVARLTNLRARGEPIRPVSN